MKLETACDIGLSCGLSTTSEAVLNIKMHAVNTFSYNEIENELKELMTEFEEVGDRPIKELFPELEA